MTGRFLHAPLALVLAVSLTAQASAEPAPSTSSQESAADTQSDRGQPAWVFEASDLPAEDGYVFGALPNGMRYVIRSNATPKGTALVRMEIGAGRLDEADTERGLAHFVEHMAFNGSTNVPEGEMVKLLERLGLAFGADTNAETNFAYTQYKLDLPNTSPALLDTALMLMRETASNLTIDSAAVDRERGVLMAERRDGTDFRRLETLDQVDFFYPGSRFAARFPAPGREDVPTADAATLRGFYDRNYVPAKTTLVVVGDFDAAEVEKAIVARFGDWQAREASPQPSAGPFDPSLRGQTDIYIDPALSEQLAISRLGPWIERPDTRANRKEGLIRAIGYGILSRRFARATRQENPPFRSAGFGTGDVLEAGRQSTLSIAAIEGRWREGLTAATSIYRQFLEFGVSDAEIAEQVAQLRTALENNLAVKPTRSHGTFAARAIALVRDERIPTSPETDMALFEELAPALTPDAVMAAVRADVIPLEDPLIRFSGRTPPTGGAEALRAAWSEASAQQLAAPEAEATEAWSYTEFGPAGAVVSDTVATPLDIRQVVFANGVRLNLKKTDLQKDRVAMSVAIDGGSFLESRETPLAVDLAALIGGGGLGRYSQDQMQSVLAGRSVGFSLGTAPDSFTVGATTTPRDLELQLQLVAAYLTDPGYRPEVIARYRNGLDDFFASLNATPSSALGSRAESILSEGDPRFTIQPVEAYRALDFAGLREAIGDRLANGAIEVALVGDFDEDAAIALVGATLGALPQREADFREYAESRERRFTDRRGRIELRHGGDAAQALISYVWPTRDYSDAQATVELNLLRAVAALEITDALRERLGKAYSPYVGSDQSRHYTDYGTFEIRAGVETGEVEATRAAIEETMARLRSEPVSADTLQRARQPIFEGLDNALKTNAGWMAYVALARKEPDRIERFLAAKARYEALTPERIRQVAAEYLKPGGAVEFVVLPAPAKQAAE